MITTISILMVVYILLIVKYAKNIKQIFTIKDNADVFDFGNKGYIIPGVLSFFYIAVITILLIMGIFRLIAIYLP